MSNFVAAKVMGVNALTLPSETVFATELKVLTLWGIPRYASPGGLSMDADHLVNVVIAKDGNDEVERQFMLSSGMISSAFEHSVPEKLFTMPDNHVEGVSAVKALQLANNQSVPIYTVNQQNFATILPQLQVDAFVKADIQNAVSAGKVVTVSKTNINFNGWSGCGYIVLDPETGSGAYMLSGGINGARILNDVILAILWITAIVAFVFVAGVLVAFLLAQLSVILPALISILSNWYLAASIFLSSSILIRALYSTTMYWMGISPTTSPFPAPTNIFEAIFFQFIFKINLLKEIIKKSAYFIKTKKIYALVDEHFKICSS